MARNLKLFRTATGFHDAFVAAPSQKAALGAWGTDKDLFARGVAEQVDDPAMLKQLSEKAGVVFRKLRGDTQDQLEALGPSLPNRSARTPKAAPISQSKPIAKPSDRLVEEARRAMKVLEQQQQAQRAAQEQRERHVREQRRDMEKRQASDMREARTRISEAEADYSTALYRWREGQRRPDR